MDDGRSPRDGGRHAESGGNVDRHSRNRDGQYDRGMDNDGNYYSPPSAHCRSNRRSHYDVDEDDRDEDYNRGMDDDGNYYSPPSAHRGSNCWSRYDDDEDDRNEDYNRHPPSRKKSMGGEHGDGGLKPRKRVWPPHFESSSASFIFDARSGMFYEPSSDFFYDPKPKLYYSNAKRQYYCYDADKRPYVFGPIGIPAIAPDTTGLGGKGSKTPNLATTTTKIAISLKTPLPPKNPAGKSLIKTAIIEKAKLNQKNAQRQNFTPSTGENAAGTLPQAHKKHARERCMVHGSQVGLELSHSKALLACSLGFSSVAEVIRPEETLNNDNNQF